MRVLPIAGRSALMTTDASTQALISAIERRLADISGQQHLLAVEKARLVEHLTPLRLGVLAPETAVANLKAKGITLVAPTLPTDRRPRLKAVAPICSAVPSGAPRSTRTPVKAKAAL
jgi:hypothetical protein